MGNNYSVLCPGMAILVPGLQRRRRKRRGSIQTTHDDPQENPSSSSDFRDLEAKEDIALETITSETKKVDGILSKECKRRDVGDESTGADSEDPTSSSRHSVADEDDDDKVDSDIKITPYMSEFIKKNLFRKRLKVCEHLLHCFGFNVSVYH